MTDEQLAELEALINLQAVANEPVTWVEVPLASVQGRPDIMQFFGDKYGETVRVVQIGGVERKLDGFSMELCAGTHLRSTGQLGAFKIISEGAISAGCGASRRSRGRRFCIITKRRFWSSPGV